MRTTPARHARHTLLGAACLGVLAVGACKSKTNTASVARRYRSIHRGAARASQRQAAQ